MSRRGSHGSSGRVAIARATLDAVEAGHYVVDGARVELAAAIEDARAGTALYELRVDRLDPPRTDRAGALSLTNESSNEAIARLASVEHLAVLNFASAKNPGGGFLGGAQAQEECLARSSALYPCLLEQPAHYERNRALHSPLYLDLAIWSPRVPFFRADDGAWWPGRVDASVITCAAPNAGAASKRDDFDRDQLVSIVYRRAAFILAIAAHHRVSHLVLGAWGAGVFKNDPALVADAFLRPLRGEYARAFDEVVFAIYGGPGENYDAFSASVPTGAAAAPPAAGA